MVYKRQALLKDSVPFSPLPRPRPPQVLKYLRVSGQLRATLNSTEGAEDENQSWWVSQLSKEGFSLQEHGLVKINRHAEVISKYGESQADKASVSECQENIQGPLSLDHLRNEKRRETSGE